MVTDRIVGEAQAAQQQVMRYEQYFNDLAYNEAMLLRNRDFDQSVKAFLDRAKDKLHLTTYCYGKTSRYGK